MGFTTRPFGHTAAPPNSSTQKVSRMHQSNVCNSACATPCHLHLLSSKPAANQL